MWWTWLVILNPVLCGFTSARLRRWGLNPGLSIAVSLVVAFAVFQLGNLTAGKAREWPLILVLSVLLLPYLAGGSLIGVLLYERRSH